MKDLDTLEITVVSKRCFYFFVLFTVLLGTKEKGHSCHETRNGHLFTLAPECYHVKRTRKGGTEQEGWLVGARFNHDHIKRYKFYWGFQALYTSGEMRGRSALKDRIHSRLNDVLVEANLGYTFAYKCYPYYSLTPFIGAGYFWENNHFHWPSAFEVKFSTHFWYGSFGFLSHLAVCKNFTVGLNARFRLPWEPKCTLSHDPEYGKQISR